MLIKKIRLQSFRSHVSTTLDLAPLTVFRGENGSGKSSVEMAIQLALAGRTDATSADGKGSSGLIRAGENKALINLLVEQTPGDRRLVECALTGPSRTVLVSKPGDDAYAGGEEWKAWLGLHRETLSCLCNDRYFVDLAPKEQADILASIVLPKTHIWEDWVQGAAHACGLAINWAKTPFEILRQGYDLAFKARTDTNRDLKNYRLPEGDTAAAVNLEVWSRALGEARADLDHAKQRKYELEAEGKRTGVLMQAAQERLAGAEGRMAREQQSLPGIEAALLSPGKLKEHEKVAKNAEKARKADADIATAAADLAAASRDINAINELSKQPECPTCHTALSEEAIALIATPLIERKNAAGARHRELCDQRKALGNPDESLAALSDHKRAAADLERARARIAEEQTAIKDAEMRIAEIKSSAAVADPVAVAKMGEQIAELTARVAKGDDAVSRARAAKDLAGRIEAAKQDRAALLARQTTLERLVEYFGATAKAEMLAASVGPFTDAMNEVLAEWGYRCDLSIDPYVFAIVFTDAAGAAHPIPLEHLSQSQRYRFAVAFQVALAIVSGFRFVIVDGADIFDSSGRNGLYAALTSGKLDQAIVLQTDEREFVPDVEGSVFYMLQDVADPGMVPTTSVRKLEPATAAAAA